METIAVKFAKNVLDVLRAELARRQEKNGEETMAFVKFNVIEVLKSLGASFVNARLTTGEKGYVMLRVEAADGGYYYPIDFFQRRKGTKEDLQTITDCRVDEAICIAGIRISEEGEEQFSMKWDAIIDGGEVVTLSGDVRKFGEGVMQE